MGGPVVVLAAWLTAGAVAAPAPEVRLRTRFIGNAAVEITDGAFTLLTDFPYRSGAFGYMTYDPAELRPRPNSLCLFTHAHADHFEPSLVGRIGCTVIGPSSVESKLTDVRAIPLQPKIQIGPLAISPIRTEHGTEEHDSYLVDWKGVRLYFTGDTDSFAELSRQDRKALFITPWLLQKARTANALLKAARIVIYHHCADETPDGCSSCLIPRAGDTFEIGLSPRPPRGKAGSKRAGASPAPTVPPG